MRYRHNVQESDAVTKWKYWENKGVFKAGNKNKLSSDGAWIVDAKGNRLARNICRSSRLRNVGLLWYGWYLKLEHLEKLQNKLKQRLNNHFDKVVRPLLTEILGDNKNATVWFSRPEEPTDRRFYQIQRRDISYRDTCYLEKDDPLRKQGWTLSWSEGVLDSNWTKLPKCQKPQPQARGNMLRKHMDYREDLQQRFWLVSGVLMDAIECRLETVAGDYLPGAIVEFKINEQSYMFKRLEHKAWEHIGTKSHQINVNDIIGEIPHGFDSYQYERQWKKSK